MLISDKDSLNEKIQKCNSNKISEISLEIDRLKLEHKKEVDRIKSDYDQSLKEIKFCYESEKLQLE